MAHAPLRSECSLYHDNIRLLNYFISLFLLTIIFIHIKFSWVYSFFIIFFFSSINTFIGWCLNSIIFTKFNILIFYSSEFHFDCWLSFSSMYYLFVVFAAVWIANFIILNYRGRGPFSVYFSRTFVPYQIERRKKSFTRRGQKKKKKKNEKNETKHQIPNRTFRPLNAATAAAGIRSTRSKTKTALL